MIHYLRIGLVPAYLLLCLILGGASAAGIWANMALQLLAVPVILWAVVVRRHTPMAPAGRQAIAILLLILALILLQLIPLPPSVWTALPGRGDIAEGFALLRQPLPWLPISLTPYQTISSALWLLPATAVALGILRLGGFRASWLAWVMASVSVLSVAIGALQVVGGAASPWYFYQITNFGTTTGFFSNANHMATLLVCTIPFLTALYLHARGKGRSVQRSSGLFVILAGTLVVVFAGLAVNGSLAGLGLAVPVLAASLLMILSRTRKVPLWSAALVALLTVGSVVAVFSSPFGNNLTDSQAQASEGSRYTSFARSLEAARDYFPAGSGIGSFREIYRTYENPHAITTVYMNHVHNDYIELALETGLAGLLILALFLAWWCRSAVAVWRTEEPDYFARAATIASAAILAHSFVDYPLRTAAIGAVFALCCALMAAPRPLARRSRSRGEKREKDLRHLIAD